MTNKQYDVLKAVALFGAPLATLIATILNIWGFPYTEEIIATLAAINTFLGGMVIILNNNYNAKIDIEDKKEDKNV